MTYSVHTHVMRKYIAKPQGLASFFTSKSTPGHSSFPNSDALSLSFSLPLGYLRALIVDDRTLPSLTFFLLLFRTGIRLDGQRSHAEYININLHALSN